VSTFLGVIVGIIGLGFLILVHELGHFIVAKATGMRVEEFSLGFGPYIFSRRRGETIYGISAIPLGGYVRVTGMHKEEFDQRVAEAKAEEAGEILQPEERRPQDPEDRLAGKRALSVQEIAATPLHRRYYSHPLWHKLLFVVAGVAMNVIVALVLLYVVGVTQGESWRSTEISEVTVGSGAAAAGIQVGDRVVSIAGQETGNWDALRWEILKHKNETVTIVVDRGGVLKELQAAVGEDEKGLAVLGVASSDTIEHRDIGFSGAFGFAGRETANTVVMIFEVPSESSRSRLRPFRAGTRRTSGSWRS
jgi:regulator of sigma E protease